MIINFCLGGGEGRVKSVNFLYIFYFTLEVKMLKYLLKMKYFLYWLRLP